MTIMSHIAKSRVVHNHTKIQGKSPFTAKATESHLADWQWQFRFQYRPMKDAQLAALQAALATADLGTAMNLWHPDFPRGIGSNMTGAVNGAGQSGTSLITDGWTPSAVVAVPGDIVFVTYTGIGSQMFRLRTGATANGSGQVTLALDAPLRGSPPDNSLVTFNAAVIGVALQARLTGWDESDSDNNGFVTVTMSAEEIV